MPDDRQAHEPGEVDALLASLNEVKAFYTEHNALALEQNQKLDALEGRLASFVPRRRFQVVIGAVVLVIVLALLVGHHLRTLDRRDAERRRADVAAAENASRIAAVARSYGNCEGINRAFEGVDIGYTYLAALSRANATTPEGLERIERAHAALRSGLNRTDCSGHLNGLSPEDAEMVKGEAIRTLPTLPLPPPPTLAPPRSET